MDSGMENSEFKPQENGEMSLSNKSEPLPSDTEHLLQNNSYVEENSKAQIVHVPEERGWKKLFAYIGPGFLVAIAYLDPGNLESDLQAGAQYKYELLWVLLVATIAGTLIQSLAANLGVVTGKHLAEHCREEYSTKARLILWLLAEVAIVASDIPEVIGTAYALDMMFHLPLWIGVLFTGFSTLGFLALQQYGVLDKRPFLNLLILKQ